MPDEFRLLPEVLADREEGVVIAIAAGKNDDTKFHDDWFGEALPILTDPRHLNSGTE